MQLASLDWLLRSAPRTLLLGAFAWSERAGWGATRSAARVLMGFNSVGGPQRMVGTGRFELPKGLLRSAPRTLLIRRIRWGERASIGLLVVGSQTVSQNS